MTAVTPAPANSKNVAEKCPVSHLTRTALPILQLLVGALSERATQKGKAHQDFLHANNHCPVPWAMKSADPFKASVLVTSV